MKKILMIAAALATLAFVLPSCKNGDKHGHEHEEEIADAEEHEHEHEHAIDGNHVSFDTHQAAEVGLKTETCGKSAFGQVIKTVGLVGSAQSNEFILAAPASGKISPAAGAVLPGTTARKGEALFYIESSEMGDDNLRVRYIEAESEYKLAKQEYERKLALAEKKIVSQSELTRAESDYERAKAVFENMQGSYSDGKFSALSNCNGKVTEVYVSNGEYVQTGQALAKLASKDRLYVQAKVQAKYAGKLGSISGANFRAGEQTWSLSDCNGRIVSVADAVSPDSPLLPVTFEIDNPGSLVPGTFIDTYIKTTESEEAITVANGAIVEEMGKYYIFKQLHDDYYEKVYVVPGSTDGLRTIILSGLEGGETVVSEGAIFLKLAQASSALDPHAGHAH